jgi:hypothetical protein
MKAAAMKPTQFLACLLSVVLSECASVRGASNEAARASVPVPTKEWQYVPCDSDKGEIALHTEYVIAGARTIRETNTFYFVKQATAHIARNPNCAKRLPRGVITIGGPTVSACGKIDGKPLSDDDYSVVISPGEPAEDGVKLHLKFEGSWSGNKTALDESVLVPYEGETLFAKDGLTLKAHFEPVVSAATHPKVTP